MMTKLRSGLWLLLAAMRIALPAQPQLAMLVLAVIFLMQDWRWVRSLSGRMALTILVLAVALPNAWAPVWGKAMPYLDVLIMLVSLSLLRDALANNPINRLLHQWMAQRRWPWAGLALTLGISPLFNMSSIPILLAGQSEGAKTSSALSPNLVARGVASANLLSPSFAPVLLTLSLFPTVNWSQVLPVSLPALLLMVLLNGWTATGAAVAGTPADSVSAALPPIDPGTREKTRSALWVGLLPIVVFIAVLLGMSAGWHRSYAQAIFVAALASWLSRYPQINVTKLINSINTAQTKLLPELMLFMSCGILATRLYVALEHPAIIHMVNPPIMVTGFLVCILLLIILPVTCRFGLHPVIPFSVAAPLLIPFTHEIGLPVMVTLWLCYWVQSLIISPSSVINLTVSASVGHSRWYQADWKFLLMNGVLLTALFMTLIETDLLH
jgi:hypothetical protein